MAGKKQQVKKTAQTRPMEPEADTTAKMAAATQSVTPNKLANKSKKQPAASTKAESVEGTRIQRKDNLRWAGIFLLLVIGIFINDLLRGISLSLCLLVWGLLLAVCGCLFVATVHGQEFRQFVGLAWREMNLVVWPSRDIVVRTTSMVSAMVVVVSFALWLVDLLLMHMIKFFTG